MRFVHWKASFILAVAVLAPAALCKAAEVPARAEPRAAPGPLVALLLPLDSPDFARPADALLQGCKAAFSLTRNMPVLEVQSTDGAGARVVAQYEAAAGRGAAVIVGPMTRSAVSVLAGSGRISVPTLALNSPEGAMPPNMYAFGLSIESEARQVARAAFAENLRKAVVVRTATPLAQRASRAFADEWYALGGDASDLQEFGEHTDLAGLRNRMSRSAADLVFLAADPVQARAVRPYLNSQIPVFTTSQINSGQADALGNVDLDGVRFVEMPWLAQPDNLTAMVFPHADSLPSELQRFYAFGIDACRIANELLNRQVRVSLEGVTGNLSLNRDGTIEREGIQSVFRDGSVVALEAR